MNILYKYESENLSLLISYSSSDTDVFCERGIWQLESMSVQGMLVTALKAGHWVLLDEINLASAETLECLSGLLESASGSIVLADRG